MSGAVLVVRPTSDNRLFVYLLRGQRRRSVSVSAPKLDQVLLPLIAKILKMTGVKPTQLSAIGLAQSPMSLASQRLAVSVVNALGWAWGLKVFAHRGEVTASNMAKSCQQAKKGFLRAEYSTEPRIG